MLDIKVTHALVIEIPDAVGVLRMSEEFFYPQPLHRLRDVPWKPVNQNVAGIFNYAVPLVQEKRRSRIFPSRQLRLRRPRHQQPPGFVTKFVEAPHIETLTLGPTPIRIARLIAPARFGKNSPMKSNKLLVFKTPRLFARF